MTRRKLAQSSLGVCHNSKFMEVFPSGYHFFVLNTWINDRILFVDFPKHLCVAADWMPCLDRLDRNLSRNNTMNIQMKPIGGAKSIKCKKPKTKITSYINREDDQVHTGDICVQSMRGNSGFASKFLRCMFSVELQLLAQCIASERGHYLREYAQVPKLFHGSTSFNNQLLSPTHGMRILVIVHRTVHDRAGSRRKDPTSRSGLTTRLRTTSPLHNMQKA
ncbi:hypothetical protein B0H34DRAFT_160433 [Crassisporium funariophilum]|nr:hypothetical protein B0H34DRAFT_160433 [Crassisporium funariophilum]